MKIVAIIQARMGSTRFPSKVLEMIGNMTMLAHVVQRVQRAKSLSQVLVATTILQADDAIVVECERLGISVFRGEEQDVLDRYHQAAQLHKADVVVRITSDCPLVDPGVVDQVINSFLDARPDYASNTLERTYPRGLDTEVMTMTALDRAWREAQEPYQRVHVTPYFYQNPNRFRLLSITAEADYSRYRWTVDTPEDLAFVRMVYTRLGNDDAITWRAVLTLLECEPGLAELNRYIQQKELSEG